MAWNLFNLFKYDPVADANDTFNIDEALNDNWDAIKARDAEVTGRIDAADELISNLSEEVDTKGDALQSDITYYVKTTGNDATGDGTSGNPYRTWNKAISMIPKNLNGHEATLTIESGTYSEDAIISRFSNGPIRLILGSNVTVNSLSVLEGSIVYSASTSTLTLGWLYLYRDALIETTSNVTIILTGSSTMYGSTGVSIGSFLGSNCYLNGSITVNNNISGVCVLAAGIANVYIAHLEGTGNTGIGLRASTGSIIRYSSGSLNAGTETNTSYGGRIYSGAQTNIPNY